MPHSPDWLQRLAPRDGFLVAVVLAALTVVYTNCEHFQANNGLGADGQIYAEQARDFPAQFFGRQMNSYYIQRISIPALLYYSSRLLHFELTDKTILRLWRGLDLACLALLAWLWCRVARELRIGLHGKWFGAVVLFVNFGVLKWSAFYCNLTDIPAYCLGMAMLHGYLERRPFRLALITFVAAFTWPTAVYQGLLLLAFPRETDSDCPVPGAPWKLNWVAALAIAGGILFVLLGMARRGGFYYEGDWETHPVPAYLNLAIAVSVTWVAAGLTLTLNDGRLFSPRYLLSRLRTSSLWWGVATWGLARSIQYSLSGPPPKNAPDAMLAHMLWTSVADPAVFLVTHALFYGVGILLAVLLWRPISVLLRRHGPGLVLIAASTIPLALASESRGLMNQLPILIPFVVLATERLDWKPAQYGLLAALNLLGSKVWITFNPDWIETLMRINIGPWISHASYAVHGAVVLAWLFLLHRYWMSRAAAPG